MGFIFTAVLLWIVLPRAFRHYVAWQRQTPAERALTTRFTLFCWVLALIFIGAILFLPNKGRVIMLLPVFVAGATLAKWWQTARTRLRREAQTETNFTRARRIN